MGLMLGSGAMNVYASPATAEAQQVKSESGVTRVSGTVVDENGDPIIGASVKVVGTNISTPTDIDGNFTLSGVKANQDVQVSYVGYIPTTLKISDLINGGGVKSPSNPVLKTSTNLLS